MSKGGAKRRIDQVQVLVNNGANTSMAGDG